MGPYTVIYLFIYKSSSAFTRSVCSKIMFVPEVRTEVSRQSHKYRGTLILNHLLKTKMLSRNYESIGKNETIKLNSNLKTSEKTSENVNNVQKRKKCKPLKM